MADQQALMIQQRKQFEEQLQKIAPRLGELLPKRAGDPNRFVRMVGTAVVRQPSLLASDVDRMSLVLAVLTLAEMGLGPGPLAHLVPFRGPGGKKFVTAIPDYKGLIDVALASGKISSFDTGCVYENDAFVYVRGSDPRMNHTPMMTGDGDASRGAFRCAYSLAFPTDGGRPWITVLPKHDIEVIRNGSKGYQFALKNNSDSPWIDKGKPGEFRPGTPSAAMAMKTCVRQQYKLLPKTAEMQVAARADDDADEQRLPDQDAALSQLLGLEQPPPDVKSDQAERLRLLKKLIEIQQKEPKRFGEAAVRLNFDPKGKLETLGTEGLSILEDDLEVSEPEGGR